MKLAPVRIDPIFVPRIWGARSLAPLFPERTAEKEPIGEVWLTGSACRIAGGPFAGRALGEAWREMGAEWSGTRVRDPELFPLLVKFIFPEEKLSVQVHPDDEYAKRHEAAAGGHGKTEMWYAVSAREGAHATAGLRPGVTRESFRWAIETGTAEDCLECIPVRAGDAIFAPAGTAHSIGPGWILCEIQEHSDITYRVFDYNRLTAEGKPRPLHIEKAMEVINFGSQKNGKLAPVEWKRGALTAAAYIACRYFATERWEFREPISETTSPGHFDLLIFLAGNGRIESGGEAQHYGPAQAWLLPAALGKYELAPAAPSMLLRTYVPDLDEFAREMKERGVPESTLSRLVVR